jgi:hypothetical protein
MDWSIVLGSLAQWFVSAYVVGSAIQYVKTDWAPKAPSVAWKIASPVVSFVVAWMWYYDKPFTQILYNAIGVLVTTFLFYTTLLKRLQKEE